MPAPAGGSARHIADPARNARMKSSPTFRAPPLVYKLRFQGRGGRPSRPLRRKVRWRAVRRPRLPGERAVRDPDRARVVFAATPSADILPPKRVHWVDALLSERLGGDRTIAFCGLSSWRGSQAHQFSADIGIALQ